MANQILNVDNSKDKENNKSNQENESQLLVPEQEKELSSSDSPSKIKKGIQISAITLASILFIIVIVVSVFSIINSKDTKIKKGVSIEGINVSGLSKEEAKNKIQTELLDKLDKTIYFQYGENVYSLALEQLEVKYLLDQAIEQAYNIGRTGSIIQRDLRVLTLKKQPENIKIDVTYDDVTLDACILDISAKLPEQVEQPSYYIENGELIITSGKVGKAAQNDETKQIVADALNNKNYNDVYYDIPTYDKYPDKIDVEQIHSEIYKEVQDAYYTAEPRMVYPEETGIDFAESIETVKEQIEAEDKKEYTVALKFTPANITLNDLGLEAFPDQLATYSTWYIGSNNRYQNLVVAANKINGTVIMPGETFSYNSTVGERTIAAGFREATVFENNQAVSGLGGGICQVSTTLYNAVLYSNLDVVERTNHMFLSTYFTGGRDATVAWGSLDFKFKNNRNYPIKIVAGVENGGVHVSIYGLKTPDDYQVEIFSNYIGSGTYQTYKKLIKDGQEVSTELISTDTYHGRH